MAISTNPKPTINRNLYQNAGPLARQLKSPVSMVRILSMVTLVGCASPVTGSVPGPLSSWCGAVVVCSDFFSFLTCNLCCTLL